MRGWVDGAEHDVAIRQILRPVGGLGRLFDWHCGGLHALQGAQAEAKTRREVALAGAAVVKHLIGVGI